MAFYQLAPLMIYKLSSATAINRLTSFFYKKTKNLMETRNGMLLGTFFAFNKHQWEAAFQSLKKHGMKREYKNLYQINAGAGVKCNSNKLILYTFV